MGYCTPGSIAACCYTEDDDLDDGDEDEVMGVQATTKVKPTRPTSQAVVNDVLL